MKALYRIMNADSTLGAFMQAVPATLLVVSLYAACRCIHSIWIIAVILPAAVELIRFVIGRSFATVDLLLNFAGIAAAYFAVTLVRTILQKTTNR